MSDTIIVNTKRLEYMADEYRALNGAEALPSEFLFSYLPGRIFDDILSSGAESVDPRGGLGLLYLSGYEGGIWLNGIMEGEDGSGIGPSGLIRAFRMPLLFLMDNRVEKRMRLIAKGSIKRKRRALDNAFDTLVMSYGYNRGYLLEILKHPPPGSSLSADYVACYGLLECRYPMENAGALGPLLPARENLNAPAGAPWDDLSKRIQEGLPSAVKRGEGVWQSIMSESEFSPESYKALVDISAEFLMLNEAVLLMAAKAIAENDEEAMDRALLADAALTVWLGGYVIGLGQ
jgi:hypothetical protein